MKILFWDLTRHSGIPNFFLRLFPLLSLLSQNGWANRRRAQEARYGFPPYQRQVHEKPFEINIQLKMDCLNKVFKKIIRQESIVVCLFCFLNKIEICGEEKYYWMRGPSVLSELDLYNFPENWVSIICLSLKHFPLKFFLQNCQTDKLFLLSFNPETSINPIRIPKSLLFLSLHLSFKISLSPID